MKKPDTLIAEQQRVYESLLREVRDKLPKRGDNKVYFETSELIHVGASEIQQAELLAIKGEEAFVAQCYLRILDRHPSHEEVRSSALALKRKELTRTELLNNVLLSPEFSNRGIAAEGLTK